VSELAGIGEPSGEAARPKPFMSLNMPSYDIAPHVHVCVTGDGSVLLDLKRDKYLGLGRRETERIAAVVAAWPRPTWHGVSVAQSAGKSERLSGQCDDGKKQGDDGQLEARMDEPAVRDLCRSLVEAGVLISATAADRGAHDPSGPVLDMRVEWVSIGDELEVSSKATSEHAINLVRAYGRARFTLRWRPFATIVEAARTRKNRRGREFGRSDLLELAALVGIFRRLRPFVFAPEGRCLVHALTLIHFLAHYDFYPQWVIGVATQPWGAHSWVQWGNYLVDSNPEKVCRFTPILVV
jgi:Transglutaminase-like superfamily